MKLLNFEFIFFNLLEGDFKNSFKKRNLRFVNYTIKVYVINLMSINISEVFIRH